MTEQTDLTVIAATTEEQMRSAYRIRELVFSGEQGVPPGLERDGNDENAAHILAILGTLPVGAARARKMGAHDYKIERIAILKEFRAAGLGRKFVAQILNQLRQQGAEHAYIHAQLAVVSFYESLEFKVEGPVFWEAGIRHQRMTVNLKNHKH